MKCPLCMTEISADATLIGPYKVYQPHIHGKEEGGEVTVCGRGFTLTAILDKLNEIVEILNGKLG